MAIKVETTTDSLEDTKRSLGEDTVVETEETPTEETSSETETGSQAKTVKAGEKTPKADAPADDDAEDSDDDDEENTEDLDDKSKTKGKEKEQAPAHKRKSGYKRKIDRISRQLEEERGKREELERRVASAEKPGSKTEPDPKAPVNYSGRPKPKREDFANDEDPDGAFIEALTDWKTDEKLAKAEGERSDREIKTESQRVLKQYETRLNEAKALVPDFDAAFDELEEDLQVSPAMQYVIFNSPVGPHISRWLALHPERAAELMELRGTPDELLEIGVIRGLVEAEVAKLKAAPAKNSKEPLPKDTPAKPLKKVVSSAPLPTTPLKGAQNTVKTLKDVAGGDDRLVDHVKYDPTYERMRKEQRRGAS